jgi:WD40 repeat protein
MALWEYPLNDYLYHIDFSHDGQNLVAASRDTIYYFKRDGTFLWKYMLDTKLDSISISQNGEIIVIGNYDNSINIIDQSGNMKKIDLGSISAMPLPPVETGLDIQISPYQGNSTGTVPTTSSAPLQGILPIISIIISAGLISHWVRKQKT